VARVAMGASDAQTLKAFLEAESYPGPALIIAYAHCISHGIEIRKGLEQQEHAVRSGHWPLFRFDPRRRTEGKSPLVLDSGPPDESFSVYTESQDRSSALRRSRPDVAGALLQEAEQEAHERFELYRSLESLLAPAKP